MTFPGSHTRLLEAEVDVETDEWCYVFISFEIEERC